jgi:hypothetical protein
MKMELTECSETVAHKIQALGNHPKERIQHSEYGKSVESRIIILAFAESEVPPSAFNGSLSAGTTVTREEQERLSTPLHVHVDPVSFLHMCF